MQKTKTRALSLLLALVMVLGLLPGTAWATSGEPAGNGTAESPYLIADAEDLKTFRDKVNGGERTLCAKLTADIELSGEWTPIGTQTMVAEQYCGTFDGNFYTISGVSINANSVNQGLFGAINDATIKNLRVEGNIDCGTKNYIGGIVGKIQTGTIENCSFSGSVSGGYTGGITGYLNAAGVIIKNCYNTASVTGTYAGGILGYSTKSATISNCYNTGTISGTTRTGGIVGQLSSGTIENCYNIGTLEGTSSQKSGICAFNNAATVNCFYKDDDTETPGGNSTDGRSLITTADELLGNLGSAFMEDTNRINDSWPILFWQAGAEPVPKDPHISIIGNTSLYMTNSGPNPQNTLTVQYTDIDNKPAVEWSIKGSNNVIELETPTDAGENNATMIVKAVSPGKATVTATAGDYTAEQEITVWPSVTTVEIEGTVAAGETVKAKINVLGGGELNYEAFPVKVQWKYLTGKDYLAGNTGNYQNISDAIGREFTIPDERSGDYLSFTVCYGEKDITPNRTYQVTAAGETEPDPQPPVVDKTLEEALNWYTMRPIFGQDTNANRVLEQYLADQDLEGFTASVKSVEEVYGSADIADNGDITYFYVDPNTTPSVKMGSFKVTFTLTKDGETLDKEIPVIVYWDAAKVKETMTSEILDKVKLDTSAPITVNMSLPKVVDGKTWALISWQSSDQEVISISAENQTTADTLFNPYVGVVRQGSERKTVTLTATFTFQLTNDTTGGEKPIVLSKTFSVTVPPMSGDQAEAIRAGLLAKLDAGFDAKGLTDTVTGTRLSPDANGIYTVSNDIQFPTTRDLGVDGKYYPVTITATSDALVAPDVNNAARVEVYRPTGTDAEGTITVTLHDKDTSITASKEFKIKVTALSREEIDRELALMEKVKSSYFDGIKGGNTSKDNVRTDLSPFFEAYEENGKLVWVRSVSEKTGQGIVPVPIEGWEELELWRLFKSSNPNVISHENLIVTRQAQAKAVTITSYLSSETLGRYGELYQKDPVKYAQYAALAPLYYQEVSTNTPAQPAIRRVRAAAPGVQTDTIVVRGTVDPESTVPVEEKLDVTFMLTGLDGEKWIFASFTRLDETVTVYDILTRALTENSGQVVRHKGTYIQAISVSGKTLSEFECGKNSGWMYRVNGQLPDQYMKDCFLRSGDCIQVFYTRDASQDDPNWSWPGDSSDKPSSSGSSPSNGNSTGGDTKPVSTVQIEKDEKAGTYTITLGQNKGTPQVVTIPNVEDGQIAIIVHPDGRAETVKKSVLVDGKFKLQLQDNATIKLVDHSSDFSDVERDAWYTSAVDFVSGRGLFSGVGGGRFAPELPLSRGMLVTVLRNLEDPEPQTIQNLFTDVADTAWYTQGIVWAESMGIISGYGDGRFGPNDNITREQLAVMLFRYASTLDMSTSGRDSLASFSDSGAVSDWAKDAVAWAVDSGIISGRPDGTLAPSGTASRAEAAVMIQRFIAVLLK